MKVLLVNHGTAAEWGGGDGVQIRETAKRLRQRGYIVDEVNSDQPRAEGYDLVHIFNCRVQHSFESQIRCCKQVDIPIVVSPIWISLKRAYWGSRGSSSVLTQATNNYDNNAINLLENLKQRKLVVVNEGISFHSNGYTTDESNTLELISSLLKEVDGLLPNSLLELQAIRSDLNWYDNTFEIAHYGVDPRIFLDANPDKFKAYSGINEPFVLQAGRIEPAKNQAMVCWALRNKNIPIIFIGSGKHWPSYTDLCKSIARDKLIVIDHIDQELLASAYAAASVHILTSWMETCGLVSLEAALSGTPLVASTFGHELEYLEDDAWYADPADPESINESIDAALQAGRNSEKTIKMKRKILEKFNWEQTVDATEKLYRRVLAKKR